MSPVEPRSAATNPFATRWTRPGAVPFQFPAGEDLASLVNRLPQTDWRGSLVGPHGSGKSTLLAALIPAIEAAGRRVRLVTLHDGQRSLPSDFIWPSRGESPGVVVIDGYEQLGWWSRRRINSACRRSGWGLLITVHKRERADDLPVLYETRKELAVLERLIDEQLPPHHGVIRKRDIEQAFETHSGNIRDAFFALYDLFEERRR